MTGLDAAMFHRGPSDGNPVLRLHPGVPSVTPRTAMRSRPAACWRPRRNNSV